VPATILEIWPRTSGVGSSASVKPYVLQNGETDPIYSYANAIRESVWVEAPDADGDGNKDLVTADIIRPRELDGKATVPVIDAAAAWEAIRTLPNTAQVDPALAPLKITKVELGTAEFDTDRGTQKLPAWNFTVVDGTGPISWPAMRPDLFWKLGAVPRSQGAFGATVSADGRNLTATMPAPPAEFCPGDRIYRYEPVVREGDTVVAIGLKTVDTGQVQPGQRAATCGYDLVLRTAPYPVSLSQPLGARVVVDTEGAPFAVTR